MEKVKQGRNWKAHALRITFLLTTDERLRLRQQAQFPPAGVLEIVESNGFVIFFCKGQTREIKIRKMMLKGSTICILVILGILGMNGVEAWGGLFNRFTPEMLSNLGYGGQGGYKPSYLQRPLVGHYGNDFGDGLQFAGDDDPCEHRPCGTNEHCCPGQVCMNVDNAPEGTCFYAFGLKQGELCVRDNDCETGLMCADVIGGDTRSCQPPVTSNKQYSEECVMSRECDITRGLCCQVQRRHRQATRKVCSYFKDPLVCIGPVATDQIKSIVQYTSGEKRITQGQHNRNLLYKRGLF